MGASGRILLVDDDPTVLEALSAALVPTYEVINARTGVSALETIIRHAPDLILLDNVLPDVSGVTILRILRQAYSSLPVILMTGFGSEDLAIEAFRGGVRDYLKKPINLHDLLARVKTQLAAGQRPEELSSGVGSKKGAASPDGGRKFQDTTLERAIAFIDDQLHTKVMLDQVAREAGMSKFHFCRYFKAVTGLTFREFLARRRIARAIELLRDRQRSVTDVYLDVGFKDLSHFGRVFRKVTGQSPSRYRHVAERSPRNEMPPGHKPPSAK
jgi:YesN/AraC family two-component response regulator